MGPSSGPNLYYYNNTTQLYFTTKCGSIIMQSQTLDRLCSVYASSKMRKCMASARVTLPTKDK